MRERWRERSFALCAPEVESLREGRSGVDGTKMAGDLYGRVFVWSFWFSGRRWRPADFDDGGFLFIFAPSSSEAGDISAKRIEE